MKEQNEHLLMMLIREGRIETQENGGISQKLMIKKGKPRLEEEEEERNNFKNTQACY